MVITLAGVSTAFCACPNGSFARFSKERWRCACAHAVRLNTIISSPRMLLQLAVWTQQMMPVCWRDAVLLCVSYYFVGLYLVGTDYIVNGRHGLSIII